MSSRFTTYTLGSIAFAHPDNWIAYPLPADHSFLQYRKGAKAWRIGPALDLKGYLPACGLQIMVQNLPDPGPRAGGELIEHLLHSLSGDLTLSLTIKHRPRGLGEVRMMVHRIQEGLALSYWNIEDETYQKRIAVETSRQRYVFDVNAPDPKDGAMDAVFSRLLASLAIRESVTSSLAATNLSDSLLPSQPERPRVPPGTARCPAAPLLGTWADSQVTNSFRAIDVSITFKADGSYMYFAGQGNAAWVTHTGLYQISEMNDQRYRCKVTLTPDPAAIKIASQALLLAVQARDLMDDKERTFLYKFFPNPNRLMLAGTWTDWQNDVGTVGLDRK